MPTTTERLAGFVERHAQHHPEGVAIHYSERQWSWAQWASRIRQAAGALRAAGVRRGQRVAFPGQKSPGLPGDPGWCRIDRRAGDHRQLASHRRRTRPRAQRQRRTSAVRRHRAAADGRGGERKSPRPGTHHRGRRRRRPVRILARRSHTHPGRPGGRRHRHRPGDLQLGHHRAPEGCVAEPARAIFKLHIEEHPTGNDDVRLFQRFAVGRDHPADIAVLSADKATEPLIVVGNTGDTPTTEYVEFHIHRRSRSAVATAWERTA
jgi:hypothetical protein